MVWEFRPAWGATLRALHWSSFEQFQSTPPRGERLKLFNNLNSLFSYFNPRPRVGSDALVENDKIWFWISIHAPAWGATKLRSKRLKTQNSIHAPRVGSDSSTLS